MLTDNIQAGKEARGTREADTHASIFPKPAATEATTIQTHLPNEPERGHHPSYDVTTDFLSPYDGVRPWRGLFTSPQL